MRSRIWTSLAVLLSTHVVGFVEAGHGGGLSLQPATCGPYDECHWERQRSIDTSLDMSETVSTFQLFNHGAEVCYAVPRDGNIGRINIPLSSAGVASRLRIRVTLTPLTANGSNFDYGSAYASEPATTWLMHSSSCVPLYASGSGRSQRGAR
jgi:hypothetical protein